MQMRIGDVRKFSYLSEMPSRAGSVEKVIETTLRVMSFDSIEVFYDVWWDHKNGWGFETSKSVTYYRLSYNYLMGNSVYLKNEPLTEKEVKLHKPDLVHRTCLCENWSWNRVTYSTMDNFLQVLIKSNVNIDHIESQPSIKTPKILLVPWGPQGGLKTPRLVEASNGEEILPLELLLKAHNIQSKWETKAKDGIGIYRSGIRKGIPSYYIGEQYDAAGNMKRSKQT